MEGATNQKIPIFDQVGIEQRLNAQVPLDLTFTDENGQPVQLGKYFGSKPVILTLVYYQCPMLCSQVLNGMTGALNGITRFNIGRDFDIVTVSFDPRDKPEDAVATKKRILNAIAGRLGRRLAFSDREKKTRSKRWPRRGFPLCVGPGNSAVCPCQQHYAADAQKANWPSTISESNMRPRHSTRPGGSFQGKIGSVVDQFILYCYHYDPARGKYGAVVFNIMRILRAGNIAGARRIRDRHVPPRLAGSQTEPFKLGQPNRCNLNCHYFRSRPQPWRGR